MSFNADERNTYKFFLFITVFNTDIGLAILVKDLEWEMLEIRLDLCIIELASDETFYIKYTEDYSMGKESKDMQKSKLDDLRIMRIHGMATWFLAASPIMRPIPEKDTYDGVVRFPWSLGK
jgi:hypothetical protein